VTCRETDDNLFDVGMIWRVCTKRQQSTTTSLLKKLPKFEIRNISKKFQILTVCWQQIGQDIIDQTIRQTGKLLPQFRRIQVV